MQLTCLCHHCCRHQRVFRGFETLNSNQNGLADVPAVLMILFSFLSYFFLFVEPQTVFSFQSYCMSSAKGFWLYIAGGKITKSRGFFCSSSVFQLFSLQLFQMLHYCIYFAFECADSLTVQNILLDQFVWMACVNLPYSCASFGAKYLNNKYQSFLFIK